MNWSKFGSFTAAAMFCGILVSCQSANNRVALPPLDESREPAPSLQLRQSIQAPEAAVASWEAFRGKVVLLEFWATWCGPCVAVIPHLNELAEVFAGEPVIFLSITDEDGETIERFLERREMKSWIGLDDDGATHRAYGGRAIPHTVIVDQHGRIAAATHPAQVTEEVIRNVLEGRDAFMRLTAGVDPAGADDDADALLRVIIRVSTGRGEAVRDDGRFTADGFPLSAAIATAYEISADHIEGLDHFGDERYTIVISAPTRDSQLMLKIMRDALEAAFNFETMREPRLRSVYELRRIVGVDHKLTPATGETPASARVSFSEGRLEVFNGAAWRLASILESFLDHPVSDETELAGEYDITMEFDPVILTLDDREFIAHITDALREQSGLDLVAAEREIEVLVIVPINGG